MITMALSKPNMNGLWTIFDGLIRGRHEREEPVGLSDAANSSNKRLVNREEGGICEMFIRRLMKRACA